MANSCCRPSARTRNRFATFAQAISSTMPTVPSRIQSIGRTSPTRSSAKGRTRGPIRVSSSIFRVNPGGMGKRSMAIGIMRAMSALACAMVTPGFRRATDW